MNINLGEPQDRRMTTGLHTVRDIQCGKCKQTLGWKYVSSTSTLRARAGRARLGGERDVGAGFGERLTRLNSSLLCRHDQSSRPRPRLGAMRYQDKAYVDDQRYKEGKFILEKNLLCDV